MGEVVRPHGVRGEVVIQPFTEEPGRFQPGADLLVGKDPNGAREMKVSTSRRNRQKLLVRFEGINDREAAETIRGSLIFIPSSALTPLGEDSFWEHDLAGVEVFDRAGNFIGRITRVVPRVEQDLWEVDSGGPILQIPAVKEIVKSVDLDRRRIVIDPPRGLLGDDNAL